MSTQEVDFTSIVGYAPELKPENRYYSSTAPAQKLEQLKLIARAELIEHLTRQSMLTLSSERTQEQVRNAMSRFIRNTGAYHVDHLTRSLVNNGVINGEKFLHELLYDFYHTVAVENHLICGDRSACKNCDLLCAKKVAEGLQ